MWKHRRPIYSAEDERREREELLSGERTWLDILILFLAVVAIDFMAVYAILKVLGVID